MSFEVGGVNTASFFVLIIRLYLLLYKFFFLVKTII